MPTSTAAAPLAVAASADASTFTMDVMDPTTDPVPVIATLPMGGGAVTGPGAGVLHVQWGIGNELRVSRVRGTEPGTAVTTSVDESEEVSSGAAYVVQWGCVTGAHEELAQETLPHFEQMRERIGLAAHRGEGPDGVAAASVDAASRFARSVGDALTRKVEALELIAADVGTRTADLEHMSLARAAWELASMYFVEPGDGTGVVTERLVEQIGRASCRERV